MMNRGGRGLAILLSLSILLPAAILAVFGFQSLRQDRVLAQRQTLDSLQRTVDLAAREVARDLARWQEWNEAGDAEFELAADRHVRSAKRLLWLPGPVSRHPPAALVRQAEEVEIRAADYPKALGLYERALKAAPQEDRAAILLRIARTAKKAGDLGKARAAWRQILKLPDSPARAAARLSLLEAGEGSPMEMYLDLMAGRYGLSRESFFFYSQRVQELLGGEATPELRRRERDRIALTEAAAAFIANPARIPAQGFFAFWDGGRAMVIREDDLQRRLARVAQVNPETAAVKLRRREEQAPGQAAFHVLDDPQLPWDLAATPADPAALNRSLRNRQTLYVSGLALALLTLVCGVFLTARAMRREWKLVRLQTEFVATVSHEFRSPLTGLRQLAELLDSGLVKGEERRSEYYRLIVQESDRLTRLVENLLDFSRVEAGRKLYRMEAIDSSRWLEDTAAAKHDARVRARIPSGLPPVRGDRDALASAIGNLMDNALKYSPADSAVDVTALCMNGNLSISVTDRGPGIAPQEQARIFEKFYRGDGELTRKVKGAGIGLSLVKRIVEDHGGRISVRSVPGDGSSFTIDLKISGEPVN